MMDAVLEDPAIQKVLHGNVIMRKIDIYGTERPASGGPTGNELKDQYRVVWIPTVIFLGAGNKELLRIPGVVTKEDFQDLLCQHVGIQGACIPGKAH